MNSGVHHQFRATCSLRPTEARVAVGEPLFDFGGESPALAAADEVARLLRTGAARLPDDVCGGCPLALQILAASFEGTLMSATEGAESVLTNGGSDGLPTDAELDEFTAQLLGAISSGLTDVRHPR